MACACSCGSGSIGRVLAVVGVVGLGIAGFNTLRSGCPLGTCSTSASAASAMVVPAENKTCPMTCAEKTECETKCPMSDTTTESPEHTPEETKPDSPTVSN